jgi:YfiR/HmsC-like
MNRQRQSRRKPCDRLWDKLRVRWTRGLWIVPFAFCLLVAMFPGTAGGQEDLVDEYKLKAAILYHLTQFVEWPDPPNADLHAPIALCILGQDPFADSLASTLPKETDNGRPMLIRHLKSGAEFPGCQILYISSSERKNAEHIFSFLSGSSVLTVGEMTQFAAHGGIVQFSIEDRHVRFAINLDAASRAGFKISSKLLVLAQIVRTNATNGS